MELNLSPELEAKLTRIAEHEDKDLTSLVLEAVERMVNYNEWFVREVEKGLNQVERGEVLEHHDVGLLLEKLLTEKHQVPSLTVPSSQMIASRLSTVADSIAPLRALAR
jgi:predicted transcriptional regulator